MDDELYQAFITESEESITQLNNSLLSLESNPEDTDAIDDIFRQAHTLKGNFGAMGFDNAATVAHAVEDLLDEIRHERLEVTPERMDLVFDGMDLIVEILHDIEENGESTIDPADTVEEIRAAVETGGDAGNSSPAAPDEDDSDDIDLTALAADTVDTDAIDATTLTHAHIELDAGDMKGVDAGIFLSSIPEDIDMVGAAPSRDDIEDGEFDDGFDLFIAELDPDGVETEFKGLWKVVTVETTDVSDALDGAVSTGSDASADADDASEGSDADADTEQTAADDAETANEEDDDDNTESDADETKEDAEADETTTDSGADDSSADESAKKKKEEKKEARSISAVKSVRVDVDQLDELHELVEQLVTSRIKLRNAIHEEQNTALDTLDELDKISSNLQNTVMDMRLIPLKKVFDKFPRLVRDLAREQDKRISFKVEGADIELDRTILDEISDPLMHVLRNAVDHGIEEPDVREANGKPRTGTVKLSARRQHDTVIVTVEDDGTGIDADGVRDKVVAEGVETREEVNKMSDSEIYDYIFHPGLSTNDEITDVSGRGVGMDVVKTTVESLDGSVSVESEPGEGSTVKIRLPVSVAIIKVLFVQVENREFGVPIKYIDEISRRDRIQTVNGAEVIVHEETIFPLIRLREALEIDAEDPDHGMVVRIRPDDRQVALHCDGVTKQEEVVVTPLQGPLSGVDGLSGTAVIGDGNVIPILDVSTLELPDTGKQAMREFDPSQLPGTSEEAAD
ncbi:taxis sensor histidine kinase cheA / two-component system, chemotaxis family, sensor kinase CheA [Haloferax mucosum ATCC BAA-1512]|uniref:Chemotaxis protein CheA n=1 Tax=Haloferax mucosum ATCC BAA-1512 TaxID=662479 RepID=M0I3H8_9EURY|nr:chemotaxis protein CheA [Haloferax mucosum]ELZ91350.1 taxis sensor histidine kinase cheA / two-component system, chemotaxis family, sensor kinase CheA [Haloferax mucosum ATCC BAA-1512]